jgi:hypothetical protein
LFVCRNLLIFVKEMDSGMFVNGGFPYSPEWILLRFIN